MRTLSAAIQVVLAAVAVSVGPAFAQIDQDEQVASLEDVGRFGIVVDVEASSALTTDSAIDVAGLRARLADRIELLAGRRPSMDPLESGIPYLYVHVNAHDAGGGLVPFSVNASFIQEVRVSAGGRRMMASTWEAGFVGIVSYDRLAAIADAAEGVCEEFAIDLVSVSGESPGN